MEDRMRGRFGDLVAHHRRVAALLVSVLAVLAAACGREGAPRAGGTVIVGMRADFAGFNPITNTAQYTDELIKYALFTPLIQYDENLEVRPYLAESWELLGDTGVVFSLRRDVRWHDGQPVTAEDVVFTFDLAKDPATGSLIGSAYITEVARAEVVDSYTVRFTFARPHAQALEDFWWPPVPKHLLEGIAPEDLRNAPFNRAPVGSGPYRFVEWRANERLVLEPNPDFPEALGGPPALERVVFRIVPDPSTLLTELLTGRLQVDIPVVPDQAAQIEENANLELFAFPSRTVYFIGWNTRREPFTDARVRRAMTHAINRQEIIEALLEGYGSPATSTIPPWSPLYPETVEPLPYDPQQAMRLLEEAGWTDRNGDGIRENAAGRPLRFTLLSSDAPLNRNVVAVVQSQLRQVGVDAQVRSLEFQTLLTQHRARDFDAVLQTWVLDNFQVASAPAALFHSRWADVPRSANRSSFANPRADSLIDAGAAETDPERAREIWAAFTELLNQEQPFTFMFWLDELAGVSRTLGGVVMDPRGELVSIADWHVRGSAAPAGR